MIVERVMERRGLIGCILCNPGDEGAVSVQLGAPERGVGGMVRRRSTIRFRKGAPS